MFQYLLELSSTLLKKWEGTLMQDTLGYKSILSLTFKKLGDTFPLPQLMTTMLLSNMLNAKPVNSFTTPVILKRFTLIVSFIYKFRNFYMHNQNTFCFSVFLICLFFLLCSLSKFYVHACFRRWLMSSCIFLKGNEKQKVKFQ